jgi:alpha-glucosidase
MLHLTRALVALRAAEPDLRRAPMRFRDAPDGVLVLDRGALRVTLNLSERPCALDAGTVLLATAPLADGGLPPLAGAIVRRAAR